MNLSRRSFMGRSALGTLAAVTGMPRGGAAEDATADAITWSRKIPVRYTVDVAVLGGGIAGVAAACAAAKSGAQVLLVERFAIAGGDLTTGGVAAFCGETAGQGEVFDEILADLEKFHAVTVYQPFSKADHRNFDHHILAIVLQELLLRRKVKLLLHTRFVDVRVGDGGRISECIVCGKSGPEAVRAKQFIDCTGDADVARMAGFAVMKGRPEDGLPLPMSMMAFVRHVEPEEAGSQLPEGWFSPVRDKASLPMTSIWPNGPRSNALKIKIPMFDATSTEGLALAEIRARRRTLEVLDYYQRVLKKPWRYDGCSPQIGIREGARITGDYVLIVADLHAGKKFEDAIARGVYPLDGHRPDDDKRTYILKASEMKVPPYQIPLRSLIAKDGANLLMAGRCFSGDQLALSSARVSTTCAMMGQAAGIAAALAAQKQTDPRKVDPLEVRRTVEERGGKLS